MNVAHLTCSWGRLKDTSGHFEMIIANDIGEVPTTVTIMKSDWGVRTSGCVQGTKVS